MFAVRARDPVRVNRAFEGLQRLAEEHKHGWGVVHFDGREPRLETSAVSARACPRFVRLAEQVATTSLLAHIRLASVGEVDDRNNHPFLGEGWAFMHNGTLLHYDRHRAALEKEIAPRWRRVLKGDTDSERCFALFLTYLDGRADPDLGQVTRAVTRVMRTASAVCDGGLPAEQRSALNFIVSDGRRLVATRRGRTLFCAQRPGARFVASEHLWKGEAWEAIAEDGILAIDEDLSVRASALHDW
jgi:predicted glutamine amidotransferase